MMIEFSAWPKTPRLFRDTTITEKIDGTNAAIGIQQFPFGWHIGGFCGGTCGYPAHDGHDHDVPGNAKLVMGSDTDTEDGLPEFEYLVYAQSRSRVITLITDNHGFAHWVYANAKTLVTDLGPGLHNGEWWGKGIQRGYGVPDKRFSLFNTHKWGEAKFDTPNLLVVPVLSISTFSELEIVVALGNLKYGGSRAAPGFFPAEGVCVYHHASRQVFKVTCDNDDAPKGRAA
jgi:hypothetical protein